MVQERRPFMRALPWICGILLLAAVVGGSVYINNLRGEARASSTALDAAHREIAITKQNAESLAQTKRDLETKMAAETALVDAEAKWKSAEVARAGLNAKIKATESAQADAEAKSKAAEAARTEFDAKLKRAESVHADLEAKFKALEAEKLSQDTKLKALEAARAELATKLTTAEQEKTGLQARVNDAEAARAAAEAKLKSAIEKQD